MNSQTQSRVGRLTYCRGDKFKVTDNLNLKGKVYHKFEIGSVVEISQEYQRGGISIICKQGEERQILYTKHIIRVRKKYYERKHRKPA